MKKGERMFVGVIVFAVLACWSGIGHAQRFPAKELTIVCGSKAGAPIDVFARAMAAKFEKYLGKPCVVQNRTGGTQAESLSFLLSKPADGHTMATATPTTVSVLKRCKRTFKKYCPHLLIIYSLIIRGLRLQNSRLPVY